MEITDQWGRQIGISALSVSTYMLYISTYICSLWEHTGDSHLIKEVKEGITGKVITELTSGGWLGTYSTNGGGRKNLRQKKQNTQHLVPETKSAGMNRDNLSVPWTQKTRGNIKWEEAEEGRGQVRKATFKIYVILEKS